MDNKPKGKTELKREHLREVLVRVAAGIIAKKGLQGLKTRELAEETGIAVGQIYNLVSDIDELILRVSSQTLLRLEEAILLALDKKKPDTAKETLVVIAQTYYHFARDNYHLWRTLFDQRIENPDKLPEWVTADRLRPFQWIKEPLGQLMRSASEQEIEIFSKTIFSTVHGIISIGLDSRDVGVPKENLDEQIQTFIKIVCIGIEIH